MFRRLLGCYTFRYCTLISTFRENVLPSSSGIEEVNLIEVVKAYCVHRMMQVATTSSRCWRRTLILFPRTRYCPLNHWTSMWHGCLFSSFTPDWESRYSGQEMSISLTRVLYFLLASNLLHHSIFDKRQVSHHYKPCISHWLPPEEESQYLWQKTHTLWHKPCISFWLPISCIFDTDTSFTDRSLEFSTGFQPVVVSQYLLQEISLSPIRALHFPPASPRRRITISSTRDAYLWHKPCISYWFSTCCGITLSLTRDKSLTNTSLALSAGYPRKKNHSILDKRHIFSNEPCISCWLPTCCSITLSLTRDKSLTNTSVALPAGFPLKKNHSIFDKRHISFRHEPCFFYWLPTCSALQYLWQETKLSRKEALHIILDFNRA
jgi:hypothetical protein